MTKFHINPDTGEVGNCSAKIKCRFTDSNGNQPQHYFNEKEARVASEVLLSTKYSNLSTSKKLPSKLKLNKLVESLVLRNEREDYISSIDKKHFTLEGHGSNFTDSRVTKTEDVLKLAIQQRGSLNGDDREKLVNLGAPIEGFRDGIRYLCVEVDGVEGLKSTELMDDDEIITVKAKGRAREGQLPSLSFVSKVKEKEPVNYATVIIGSKLDDNNKPIDGEMLWTMFPGTANWAPRSENIRESGLEDGSQIKVRELRKMFGRNFKVNTELI